MRPVSAGPAIGNVDRREATAIQPEDSRRTSQAPRRLTTHVPFVHSLHVVPREARGGFAASMPEQPTEASVWWLAPHVNERTRRGKL